MVLRSLLLAGAMLVIDAGPVMAQGLCRSPNVLTRTRKSLAANIAVTKALEVDVRVRGSAAGMRRALAGLTEGAHLYGQICDRPGEFVALTHAAAAHRLLGRADSALATYRRALRVAGQLAPLDTLAGAETFKQYIGGPTAAAATVNHYIGDVYRDLGRPDSALLYYRRGEGFVRHRFDINLGEQELGGGGVDDREGSRVVNRNRRTAPHATLASIGDVFRDLHRPDSALSYYRRAMALARDDSSAERIHFVGYGEMNMHEARYQIGMGSAFLDLGRADSALAAFRSAGALARNWPLGQWAQRRARTDVLDGIARALVASGRADSALVVQRDALTDARKLGDRWAQMRALHAIGRLHHRELPQHDLERAVAYYDSAATALGGLSGSAGGDANRVTVAERGVALVADWAMAWLARAPETGERRSALAALGAAERGRAQALLRLIAAEDSGTNTRPGGDVTASAERIVAALGASQTSTLTFLVTTDTLVSWLSLPDGDVMARRTAIERDSLASLVAAMRGGLGVDDAATRSRLGGIAPVSGGVDSSGAAQRGAPAAPLGLAVATNAATVLSDLLLPREWRDRLAGAGEVVVVPNGPLALLPFGALPFGRDAASADDASAMWGSRFAVRYAPSLATLTEVETRAGAAPTRTDGFRNALIAGNPAMPTIQSADGLSEILPPLPSAEGESRWLAHRLDARALTGSAATEREVRATMPRAGLIHLATHGFAYSSDARARDSFVALAADSANDGLLTVGEILDDDRVRLTADLVVLSACQTGLGDLKDAEGTIGLPRAFLAKGARSVLVSLWSVSDDATRLLMERFYTHWLDDADAPTKAMALQRAAVDVRKTEGFEHPRYWAAFQLIGAR
jgi:tetratricopeptide (TPR) repeat protein